MVLTPAGATFPYGRDPEDANIRVAPTYPSLPELEKALELMICCVRLALNKIEFSDSVNFGQRLQKYQIPT